MKYSYHRHVYIRCYKFVNLTCRHPFESQKAKDINVLLLVSYFISNDFNDNLFKFDVAMSVD